MLCAYLAGLLDQTTQTLLVQRVNDSPNLGKADEEATQHALGPRVALGEHGLHAGYGA